MPLSLWGGAFCVTRVYIAEPRKFTVEDLELVEAITDLGAEALDNTQLTEELRRNYVEPRQNLVELYAARRGYRPPQVITDEAER